MRLLRIFLFLIILHLTTSRAICQQAELAEWPRIEGLLRQENDSITVLNFWATWCKPCVAEIPHFEKVRKEFEGRPILFIYISLDFAEEKEKRLDPFVARKMPGARVWLLTETDYNRWISLIDPNWSGSLPATLIYNHSTKKRIFADAELSEDKLKSYIKQISLP
jgi:thiol-disulfide isomerase/thioredoxin